MRIAGLQKRISFNYNGIISESKCAAAKPKDGKMCDVTRYNFPEVFPEIERNLKDATFIAIDLEFSGLTAEGDHVNSLFDTAEYRYQKLRMMAQKFTIPQFGLTAFIKCKDSNQYKAFTYNFYIFPASWGCIDSWLTCQASSLKFLTCHKFDFNKWIYQGISYLTKNQEENLQALIEQSPQNLARDIDDDSMLRDLCKRVADWLLQEQDDAICLGEFDVLKRLYIQLAFRRRFPTVNVEIKSSGEVVVSRISESSPAMLSDEKIIAESILDHLLGFTKVIRLMIENKKPLIGHNCLTDMLLIYEKFLCPLPEKLSDFKKVIHDLFPVVMDTKTLIKDNRKVLKNYGIDIPSTALQKLYLTIKRSAPKMSALNSPIVAIQDISPKYENAEHLHEAGYDSYLAGFIFIKLAHILAVRNMGEELSPLITFHDYLQAVRPSQNKLNLIGASVGHVSFHGGDPASRLPGWIHIRAKGAGDINLEGLYELFAGYNGTVNIRVIDSKTAVVAASSYSVRREILKDFKGHQRLAVRKYDIFQHNKLVRYSMWSSLAVMSAVCLWTVFRGGKPP